MLGPPGCPEVSNLGEHQVIAASDQRETSRLRSRYRIESSASDIEHRKGCLEKRGKEQLQPFRASLTGAFHSEDGGEKRSLVTLDTKAVGKISREHSTAEIVEHKLSRFTESCLLDMEATLIYENRVSFNSKVNIGACSTNPSTS